MARTCLGVRDFSSWCGRSSLIDRVSILRRLKGQYRKKVTQLQDVPILDKTENRI